MKLQKREKVLLTILLLLAVILLPWFFLIQPQMEANQQKQTELSNLNIAGAGPVAVQYSLPELEAQLDEFQKKSEDSEPSIPNLMKTYDIHYFVEDVCNGTGVNINGLSVGEYSPVDISPAFNDDGNVTANTDTSIVYVCRVNLQLNGSFSQLLSTVDAFADYGYIKVSQCGMDEIASGQPIGCTLGLDIYAVLRPGDPGFAEAQAAISAEAAQSLADAEQAAG